MSSNAEPSSTETLRFYGGLPVVALAPVIFIAFAIYNLVFLEVYDTTALVAGGFVALIITSLFARRFAFYWESALNGIMSTAAVNLIMILLVVSLISELLDVTNISSGFIWLATQLGVSAGLFIPVTFILVCIIASATGTSLGTLFTSFPVFFPAGLALGAHPTLLAGAILSGCLFGDNIAPISDSSIVSALTQEYRKKRGTAEVGGVIASRAKYSFTAAAIAIVAFGIAGVAFTKSSTDAAGAAEAGDPSTLFMVIPIVLLIYVAIKKRDIFLAITLGVISGVIVGLLSGNLTGKQIVSAGEENGSAGFIADGIANMLPLIGLSIVVFAIIGTFQAAGLFDWVIDSLQNMGMSKSPMRAELLIFGGSIVTTGLFASVNGPAMLMFGPIADRVGSAANLHPYRRSNVMDCGALGLGSVMPVISTFLIISSQVASSTGNGVGVSTIAIFAASFYPLALTLVMLAAIVTGWGRAFEGPEGSVIAGKTDPQESTH